jgi:hypothetical protein
MNTRFSRSTGKRVGAYLQASFVLPLLFLGAGGQAPFVMAQSAGTFTATGNMTSRRLGHTATLLADGRVLIAGGAMIVGMGGNLMPLASAELYDPSTGVFTPTGDMTTPRGGHVGTLLPDGRALIIGGGPGAEFYDPSTGTFTGTTSPGSGMAVLPKNGNVLMLEGRSARLYDPVTDTATRTGDRTMEFSDTATLLSNGQVLIYTGAPEVGPFSAELFDPSTGTFTQTGTSTINHTAPTATLLPNGKVLLAGGDWGDGDGGSYVAELYDPATGAFAATGNLIVGREQNSATLLADGTVLFAGGHAVLSASAEVYNSVTGTFAATGNMITGRELHTATLLKDGRVLITGGDDERYWVPDTILASAELYRPAAVQGAPTVRIVDNNTGSRTTLAVGDSFSFQVTGAPVSPVSVSEAGWSGSVGYTDASGLFWLNGIVGNNVVGTWQ